MNQTEFDALINRLDGLHRSVINMVEGLTERQINYRPIETPNTIGILAHHIADAERWLIGKHFGGQAVDHQHDDAFRRTNTTPDEVLENLRDSFANSMRILRNTDAAALSEPGVRFGDNQLTKHQTLIQAMVHLAHHRGYMAMLKRLCHG